MDKLSANNQAHKKLITMLEEGLYAETRDIEVFLKALAGLGLITPSMIISLANISYIVIQYDKGVEKCPCYHGVTNRPCNEADMREKHHSLEDLFKETGNLFQLGELHNG